MVARVREEKIKVRNEMVLKDVESWANSHGGGYVLELLSLDLVKD